MDTTTSSLFTKLKDQNKVNLPQVLLVTFVIAISVGAFVFAAKLRMNSDVAPEDSSADALYKERPCRWDVQCNYAKGEKCLNNKCIGSKPIDPKPIDSGISRKCKASQDCYPNFNTCVNNVCKTEEYPKQNQNLEVGGGYMFKLFIPSAKYYQYTLSQNNKEVAKSGILNNGEFAVWQNDVAYKNISTGKLNVKVEGWNDSSKNAKSKKTIDVNIIAKCTTVAQCNNIYGNKCSNGKCTTEEYPAAGQKLTFGEGLMFKQFIKGALNYKYEFKQNGKLIHTSAVLTNGEYGIWPDNTVYKQFVAGNLEVTVSGWDNSKKSPTKKSFTVVLFSNTPSKPKPSPTTPVIVTQVPIKPTPIACEGQGSQCGVPGADPCCAGLVCTRMSGSSLYSCQKTPTPTPTPQVTPKPIYPKCITKQDCKWAEDCDMYSKTCILTSDF